ncbi:Uridine phosphorylase 2 [Eumeta japonica]|uniref:Uridine phosphorylase 2 n=1 Tax=Eumeta variegata TaxID=151549 RepID=A0A4C1WFG4_EUMVA|nr:Uridine phosphorylase 2 [Eumeta japonica]
MNSGAVPKWWHPVRAGPAPRPAKPLSRHGLRFVCMGGTKQRMKEFAGYMSKMLKIAPDDDKLINLTKHSHRYALYKVGPVLSVNHGIGIPSMTVVLQEVMKLLCYAKAKDPIIFRIGTSGGLKVPPGSVVVSSWGMNGLLEKTYDLAVLGQTRSFPAIFDERLNEELMEVAGRDGEVFATFSGGTMAADDFYRDQLHTPAIPVRTANNVVRRVLINILGAQCDVVVRRVPINILGAQCDVVVRRVLINILGAQYDVVVRRVPINILGAQCDVVVRRQARLDGPTCDHTDEEKLIFLRRLSDLGVRNIEMEATAFAALTSEAGFRSADVCVTFLDRMQGDQRACEPLKCRCSPPPMNTRNPRRVASPLPAFWAGIEYLVKGEWATETLIHWTKGIRGCCYSTIPTKAFPNCVKKLVDLYHVWRELQKNCKKTQVTFKNRENNFVKDLDNLFDIAHADAFDRMKIEKDKDFLRKQREAGRPGCLGGIDQKLAEKKERVRQRRLEEEERKVKRRELLAVASTSSIDSLECLENSDEEQISNSVLSTQIPRPEKSAKRGTKKALGLNSDDFPINKSSIQRICTQARKSRAEAIKTDFQNNLPDVITVHWDGKLLPGLDVRSSKKERLPIIASFDDREQLLAVPKLESSSGKHQAKAISTALFDWNLHDKVQIMCCDTTASNTGRFSGACAILEQTLEGNYCFCLSSSYL